MRDLAAVYKSVFPALIGNSYSAEKFRFRHTDFQRTEGSFKAFAEGLFGEGAYNTFTIEPPAKISMLLNVRPSLTTFYITKYKNGLPTISANGLVSNI